MRMTKVFVYVLSMRILQTYHIHIHHTHLTSQVDPPRLLECLHLKRGRQGRIGRQKGGTGQSFRTGTDLFGTGQCFGTGVQ